MTYEQLQATYTAYVECGMELLKHNLKEFFEKNPRVVAFKWVHYTPMFNDGDICEFTTSVIGFVDVNPSEEERDSKKVVFMNMDILDDKISLNRLENLIGSPLMEQVFKSTFGSDNASMWATREGIDVGYYDPGY